MRLDFVLPSGPNTFMDLLAAHLERRGHARAAELAVRVHRVDGFSPEALAASLRALQGDQRRHRRSSRSTIPLVREAIRETAAAGTPVLTLVSDIAHAPRLAYVGIDNRNAGRLAGHLLGRFVPGSAGEVALFAGSLSYRGHEEREMGFRHILAEDFPNLRIVELREVRDDLERSYPRGAAPARRTTRAARDLQYRRRQPGHRQGARGSRAGARSGVRRPRADRAHPPLPALGHHGRRRSTRTPSRGARGDRAACCMPRAASQRPDPVPIRIHAIFRENIPEVL